MASIPLSLTTCPTNISLTHPSTRTPAIRPPAPVMSNVRPQPEETKMLVCFALNILHSCNQHRLFTAHSGVNLPGLPLLQPTNQPSSQPTLKSKVSSHFQPPLDGAFFNLRPLRLHSESTSPERSSPAHAKNEKICPTLPCIPRFVVALFLFFNPCAYSLFPCSFNLRA